MMKDEDYKYPRVKWRLPWPCWIGIAMFIGGILVIIFFSPPEIDYIASICSIGGLLITAIIAGFDYTNKTVVSIMQEEFKLNRESHEAIIKSLDNGRQEHNAMMESFERGKEEHKAMAEEHKAMIEVLKNISSSLKKEGV